MSAVGGFPAPGAPHAELERRYRRWLRLYPREFRARRADEMLGVLMESAADGQHRPARGDVGDILRGSLLARLRGPRGGWPFALAGFALVAPLFLVLTDILQVAFPYSGNRAAAHGLPGAGILKSALAPPPVGGLPLLSQPAFLILAAGHLIVAAAVLAGCAAHGPGGPGDRGRGRLHPLDRPPRAPTGYGHDRVPDHRGLPA